MRPPTVRHHPPGCRSPSEFWSRVIRIFAPYKAGVVARDDQAKSSQAALASTREQLTSERREPGEQPPGRDRHWGGRRHRPLNFEVVPNLVLEAALGIGLTRSERYGPNRYGPRPAYQTSAMSHPPASLW